MNSVKQNYLKASFLVCVALLLAAATTKTVVIQKLGVFLTKEPVPLQHSLEDLNEAALTPYVVKDKATIQNRDVLESLGTDEYIQWILEDTEAEPASPTRYCSLFITYYTGNPDMVPHVPDECYVGGGNSRISADLVGLIIQVPKKGDEVSIEVPITRTEKIPFQYVVFGNIGQSTIQSEVRFSVQYLFHANGKYCGSRTETRKTLGQNFFSKYSYFAKVEWKFYGADSFGMVYPDKEQTLAASEKLLTALLPELEKNHWPDWEAINAKDNKPQETPAAP